MKKPHHGGSIAGQAQKDFALQLLVKHLQPYPRILLRTYGVHIYINLVLDLVLYPVAAAVSEGK